MKNKYNGTKTEMNLREAFAGESMARNKYTLFADTARKQGFEQIASIFQETADNERAHALLWLRELNGISMTKENLSSAAEGEMYEFNDMYQRMAKEALEEGFNDLAEKFLKVAEIEHMHEKRFRKLLQNVENDKVFEKCNVVMWECRNCGHIVIANNAPKACEVCHHSQSFFEVKKENY